MILPLSHERTTVRKLPWVSFAVIALCVLAYLLTRPGLSAEAGAEQELNAALGYYVERPYLQIDARLVPPESRSMLRDPEAAGRKPDAATMRQEQEELDRLTRDWLGKVDGNPIWRFGLVPAEVRPAGVLGHMFLHGGLLHLFGNLLFFYVLAPFVEDAWGRKRFAAFYVAAGLFSGLAFSLHYPDLYRPLIGASGAVAAVMGAFAVLFGRSRIRYFYFLGVFFGTFYAPAWLMLPMWFFGELASATVADSLAPGGLLGGVAYWAHVWGFLFGVVVAAVARKVGGVGVWAGEKADPSLAADPAELTIQEAWRAESAGDASEAWGLLAEAMRHDPGNPKLAAAWWGLAVRQGREREVVAEGVRLVRVEVQSGEAESAITHWRELRRAVPEVKDAALTTRLCEEAFKRGWKEDAHDLVRQAVADLNPDSPLAVAMKLVRLSPGVDLDLHQQAVGKALQNPHLTLDLREQLEGKRF